MTDHAHNHYHLPRMKEMGKVYWCHSLGGLGISLVAIFVPIYLLKIGYSFDRVMVYLIMQQAFAGLLQYPVSRAFEYLTPHYLLALGSLFSITLFTLLASQAKHYWPLWLLALIWAMNRATYWTAFHYTFSSARAHKKSGRQIAGINALNMFAAMAAPAVGGIVATVFGIKYIYAAAIFLLWAAIVPMLSPNEGPATTHAHMTWPHLRAMRRDVVANAFNGITVMAEQNIWPLLVFFLVKSYAGVGALSSVIALASMAMALYVGRGEEHRGEHYYIQRGAAAYSLTSVGRTLAQNTTQVFGLNLLGGVGRSMYVTPFMNRYYTHADGQYRLGYIAVMESSYAVGTTLYLLGLLALASVASVNTVLTAGLAVVAVAALGVRLIR